MPTDAQRLLAAQRFAQIVPWCRIRLFGMNGDNGKELVLEPTAPLPGRSASGATAGSSSSAADPAGSGSPAAPDLALERKVAQWLLDWKLPVQLSVQGQKVEVRPGSPLPAEPFTVLSLPPSAPVEIPSDVLQAGLVDFAKLSGFTGSYLPRRDSDQWAEAWVKIPTAVVVNAAGCDLTDRGLSAWSQVPRLSYLNLGKCPNVTGAGLAALASCREIGTLELEPEVFAAGKYTLADVEKLRAALPGTRIQFAGGKQIPGLAPPAARPATMP